VYDDRPELNTILQNFFANEKIMVPDYQQLVQRMNLQKEDYVVVMTIGYRTDKIVLQQLLREDIYYLGMMGSRKKRELLFGELVEEGFSEQELAKVYTPIGIEINSITAPEIAVSIAAEIIREKNKI
jgi:xanthine dehydrogenase accessory factor